jgi:cytochrome b subunit of formate dehydrogenase
MRYFAICCIGCFAITAAIAVLHYLVFRPWRNAPARATADVRRYSLLELLCLHATLIGFLILAVTALIPVLESESLEGWLLMVHVGLSPIFFLGLLGAGFLFAEDCRFTCEDGEWLCQRLRHPLQSATAELPAGRFDPLQKIFFWLTATLGLVLLTSMMLSMVKLIGPEQQIWLARTHRGAALILICLTMLQVYRTLLVKPGALSALVSGRVSSAWLKRYHSLWPGNSQS